MREFLIYAATLLVCWAGMTLALFALGLAELPVAALSAAAVNLIGCIGGLTAATIADRI